MDGQQVQSEGAGLDRASRRRARRRRGRGAGNNHAGLLAAGGFVVVVALLSASCATRVEPSIDVPSPRYPDYAFPAPPDGVGDPDARAALERAWQLLQSGDLGRAERDLVRIARRLPAFFPADAALGYLQLAREHAGEALSRFDRALGRARSYVPALVGRGDALLAAGRAGEALAAFERALTADPTREQVRRRVELLRFRVQRDALGKARAAAAAGEAAVARAAYEQAIAASPDSAFLYRELAAVERKEGALDAALVHLRRAVELDPDDAAAWFALGDLLETRGEAEPALAAFAHAQTLEPADAVAARVERARRHAEAAKLPSEYRAIPAASGLTRADLAALIGVRLGPLVSQAPWRRGVLITDAQGHWAASWILAVARAGIMEEYPNHTFRPRAPLLRTDLAEAASRVLDLVAARRGATEATWRAARPLIADLPPGHLGYPSAATAVAAGVMALDERGAFHPSRVVTGPEAQRAIDHLEGLAR